MEQTPSTTKMNVTIRPKRLHKAKSIESICSSLNLSATEELTRSLDLSTGQDIDFLEKIKTENQLLSEQLQIANNEIENLHLELNQLKNLVNLQTRQINSLKNICATPPTQNVKNQIQSKRRKSRRMLVDNSRFGEPETDEVQVLKQDTEKPIDFKETIVDQTNISKEGNDNTHKKNVNNLNKIHIFGGEQCRGLSSELINSRLKGKYLKYSISGFIKPGARTKDILKGIQDSYSQIKENDRVILSIGEHDVNPTHVMTETSAVLKLLENRHVFVTSIISSKYLNEKMLNNLLKIICLEFKNCQFIDLSIGKGYNRDKVITYYEYYDKVDLNEVCNQINLAIDYSDYKQKYLTYGNKNPKSVHTAWPISIPKNENKYQIKIPKKGTIPYYFQLQSQPNKKTSTQVSNISLENKQKKGTIPYYFMKSTKTVPLSEPNIDNFFRSQ